MKLYGLELFGKNHAVRGCCPGHDLFPRETYNNKRSVKAHRRDTKLAHRQARHAYRREVRIIQKEIERGIE